jgi:hypothetical protein
MKTLVECIAGFAVIFGWWWLVTAVFGPVDQSGLSWFVFMFGLPCAAVIELFLMGWQKARRG